MGAQDAVADGGGGGGGCCRMHLQVAYKYGSFVHSGKVKRIRNLGCSCPSSVLFFLSRDFDRG